jgi:hypothetical protein
VRCAIDAQVDPTDTPDTRRERLGKALRKIVYRQKSRKRSAKSHRKHRLKELHGHGIRLSELRKCS